MEEKFDTLLKIVTGKSLKEDAPLWLAFVRLKKARNSFVHDGKAVIDRKTVTSDETTQLVQQTKEIITWIEKLVRAEDRWLTDDGRRFTYAFATSPVPML